MSDMLRSATEERAYLNSVTHRSPLLSSRSAAFSAERTPGSPRLPSFRPKERRIESAPPSRSELSWLSKCFMLATTAVVIYGLMRVSARRDTRNSTSSAEQSCDPFFQPGRLMVDSMEVQKNAWIPFNPTCGPSALVNALRTTLSDTPKGTQAEDLPFLYNKTVVLIGDSIERLHLDQFCSIAGGSLATISPSHPLAGSNYTELMPFEELGNLNPDEETADLVYPHVCYVERYNFVMVSLYTWGMSTPEEFSHGALYKDPEYHAPAATEDRIQFQLLPLLENLGRQPDIVEFGSLFNDLSIYSQMDKVHHAGMESAAWAPLSDTRISRYGEAMEEMFLTLAEIFPSTQSILWRSTHLPKETWTVPFERVAALDSVGGYVVEQLKAGLESKKTWRKWMHSFTRHFRMKIDDSEEEKLESVLASKIRVNPIGFLLRGMQQHYTDDLHPGIMTGGLLWSNIILHGLQRLG